MASRTLCKDVLSVEIAGAGERTLIEVKDQVSARLWCDTRDVLAVLRGIPLQLSAHEGYCYMRLDGDLIRLDFSIAGERRKSCAFPAEDLRDATERIRQSDAHL